MANTKFKEKLEAIKLRLDANRPHALGEETAVFSVLGLGNSNEGEIYVTKPELRRIIDLAVGNLAAQEYIAKERDGRERIDGNKLWYAALRAVERALGRLEPNDEAPYYFNPAAEMYTLCELREREVREVKALNSATDARAAALSYRLRKIVEISAKGKTKAMEAISKIAMGAEGND